MSVVRSILLALLVSLGVGLAIGTWIRLRLERPTVYLGRLDSGAGLPLDIGPAGAPILDPRQGEEQIG